jgi:uncharacterized membrane protein YphA (DoxX/SURF4 family)
MLRVCVAAMLLLERYPGTPAFSVTWDFLVLAALCILLCVGLFTPAACVISALLVGIRLPLVADQQTIHTVLTLVVTISLALLGPGAFSIDAKLFGRRIVPVS